MLSSALLLERTEIGLMRIEHNGAIDSRLCGIRLVRVLRERESEPARQTSRCSKTPGRAEAKIQHDEPNSSLPLDPFIVAVVLALGCSEGPSGPTDMNTGSGGAASGSGGTASGSGGQQTSSGGQTGGSAAAASGGQAQTGGSANSGGTGGSGVGGSLPGSGGSDGDGGTVGTGVARQGCVHRWAGLRATDEGGPVEVTGGGQAEIRVVVDSFEALQTLAV